MEPNFHDKEYLLVEKLSYRFSEPKRGDVIIFYPPNNPSNFYIKRIIGLPNEKVVVENSRILVYDKNHPDGFELKERYLLKGEKTSKNTTLFLKESEYFVLGDNRENSSDSREFGAVSKESVAGRAFWVVLPFSNFGLIERVKYPGLNVLEPFLPVHQKLVQN